MKILRHPVRAIREPFGTAGLIVAVVALIAALGGSALAAKGALTGKQKKEVEKIAKKYAGKPGAPGATGPQGSPGAKGDTGAAGAAGKDGTNGTPGTNGTDGKSVVTGSFAGTGGSCTEGGATVEVEGIAASKKFICNGKNGSSGGPLVLGPSQSETGVWRFESQIETVDFGAETVSASAEQYVPISFPIPLDPADAAAISVKVWKEGAASNPAECDGTLLEPKAEPGTLCVYIVEKGFNESGTNDGHVPGIWPPDYKFNTEGVGVSGALLSFENVTQIGRHVSGTFAVTAPLGS